MDMPLDSEAAQPLTPSLNYLWRLRNSLFSGKRRKRFSSPVLGAEETRRWDIPIANEAEEDNTQSEDQDWADYSCKLKILDEKLQKDYTEEIETYLTFAGLFSGVLAGFVIFSYSSLQEDSSQIAADALYHISRQLHNSTVLPLATRPPFQPAPSDIRVSILWLASLVMTLVAALLGIAVKQWLRQYMSWTRMVPSKTSVAVRQYRREGWDRWLIPRWRNAIPVLLQIALVLFFGGLVDLLWHTHDGVALAITVLVGTFFGIVVLIGIIVVMDAQAPFRSPYTWVLTVSFNFWSRLFVDLVCIVGAIFKPHKDSRQTHAKRLLSILQKRLRYVLQYKLVLLVRETWSYWDLSHLQNRSHLHVCAMQAMADVVASAPSATLAQISAKLHSNDGATESMPIHTLWPLLKACIHSDDKASWAMVLDRVNAPLGHSSSGAVAAFPDDFCRRIASLVRSAVRSQRRCTAEQLVQVREALNMASALARTRSSGLPYHATTLVWMLHSTAPNELTSVAAEHLSSWSTLLHAKFYSKHNTESPWASWRIMDIVAYFEAVSAILELHCESDVHAKTDMVYLALNMARNNLETVCESPRGVTALQTLFKSMAGSLQNETYQPPNNRRPEFFFVRQDWCLLLSDLILKPCYEAGLHTTAPEVPHGASSTTLAEPSSSAQSLMTSAPVPTTGHPTSVITSGGAASTSSRVAEKWANGLMSEALTPRPHVPATAGEGPPASLSSILVAAAPFASEPFAPRTPPRTSTISIVLAALISATLKALQRSGRLKVATPSTPDIQIVEALMRNVQTNLPIDHAPIVAAAIRGCFGECNFSS